MTHSKQKLVAVQLEWDDGEIIRLEGEDAETWRQIADSALAMNYIHGDKRLMPEFKVIRKGRNSDE